MKLAKTITVIFLATILTAVAASAQAVKHVDANGMSFAYIEAGSGPPLVLVHGSSFDYREWSKQIKPLARHYRVIAYSRRYHWPNAQPGTDADSSHEVQVEDLAAIIKGLKLGPVHLVGHSVGGAVALQLALRYPELVRSLVLADPGVGSVLTAAPEEEAARLREGQANRIAMKEAFASGDAARIVRTNAADVALGVYEKAGRDLRQMLLDNVPAFQLDYYARRLPFTCEMAAKITAPALVVTGDQSPLQRIAEKTATCLKNARFVSISKATHWIPHDRRFNEILLNFLSTYKRPNKLVQPVDHRVYATPDRESKEQTAPKTQVVMLGTGAPGWDPDRSGPATAIVVNDTPYLVDFGPGVVRRAGAAYQKGVKALYPPNIRVAFLTHRHVDHTVGYADLIFSPAQAAGKILQPLEVYGPTGLKEMTEHILKAHMLKPNDERYKVNAHEIKPGIVYKDANVTVTAFPVKHGTVEAYGYRFETPDRTIVISGDTAPTQSVIDNCNGCDVLIHEAYSMFTHEKVTPENQAERKNLHTSSYELAEIANKAKPKLLVLYHRSNIGGRGGPNPEEILVEEIKKTYKGKVVTGHDLDIF